VNQEISVEEYKQALRAAWEKLTRESAIISVLLTLIGFGFIYFISDPSIIFFIYVAIGIGIILILSHFIESNIMDISFNEAEKGMYTSNLDEFKQAFREAFKQQHRRSLKYFPISISILGILTYLFVTHYPQDTWFIWVLAIAGFLCLLSILLSLGVFLDELYIKPLEEEAMKKLGKQ